MTTIQKASQNSTELALYVDLPKFDFPVVFGEMVNPLNIGSVAASFFLFINDVKEYIIPDPTLALGNPQQPTSSQQLNAATTSQPTLANPDRSSNAHPTERAGQYSLILDPDIVRDNPVEAKHRRLVRSHRNGPLDRDLKPNPKIRDELNVS